MTIMPYGAWSSPIGLDDLVGAGVVGLEETLLDGEALYWLESRPAEAGRVALCRRGPDARVTEPAGEFGVRSRVHEYGGGAFHAAGGVIVFSDQATGRVMAVTGGVVRPLTGEDAGLRFGDLRVHPERGLVLAVREDHRGSGEPVNTIVLLTLDGDNPDGGRVIRSGADFYAAPELAPDGRLAWVQWDHPWLPWDASQVWVGPLEGAGAVVAGAAGESAFAPRWLPGGRLAFLFERDGFWTPWIDEGAGPRPLTQAPYDFAQPLWVLGSSWLAPLGADELLCAPIVEGRSTPHVLSLATGELRDLGLGAAVAGSLTSSGERYALVAGRDAEPRAVLLVTPDGAEVVRAAAAAPLPAEWVSRAEAVSWVGEQGPVHGWFYPPTNPNFRAPSGERPPLIVLTHGGPTAMATPDFSLALAFWTSRGFAILDVNYGGSSGFGRAYRESLRGRWGVADVADCVAGALAMAAAGRVDRDRLAIKGGSAGGYTTLRALTTSDVFAAGVSRYGIGDLTTLATDTHKFEARYLDGLVGPWPEAAALYRERSPINHVDALACPMLILQGADDAVVPPNQAQAMAAAVRARGLPVELIMFPGEGHGFRRADTQRAALAAELAFYGRVFGFAPAG